MTKLLDELEKSLGYRFKDRELVAQSLTHKSYAKTKNNERLEFLGDAVLDLVVAEYLYNRFPLEPEGELSKLRASLVSEKGFMELSLKAGLDKYMLISSAEENNEGRIKASLLANVFEALMGAIYIESGIDAVKGIATKLLEETYPKIDIHTIFKDYKTMLQEQTQARFGVTPEYIFLRSLGPDHKKEFEMAVIVQGKELARSKGYTKKAAEQSAAGKALDILKKDIS